MRDVPAREISPNLDSTFYHPNRAERSGSVSMTGGYFIQEDVRAFDNEFFGINNLEATYMDHPQQRKLLEVAFECFESAGGIRRRPRWHHAAAKLELHTSLKPTQISSTTSSKTWWDISIVSFVDDISTKHVNGAVSFTADKKTLEPRFGVEQKTLAPTSSRVWYEAMIREGLNFGPAFRSITGFSVDRMRKLKHCISSTQFFQGTPNKDYPIHPINIDAMLQTAIVAVSAGEPETLRAVVPTKIGSTTLLTGSHPANEPAHISSRAAAVGFGASLLDAELRAESGYLVVQLQDV